MAKGKKKLEQPAWHANFRVVEALPDIKPIRTDFLLNFVALALLLGLGCYVAFTEYEASALRSSIAIHQGRIQAGNAENTRSLRISAEFDRLSTQLKDASDFTAMTIEPTEFLSSLVTSLPPEMLLANIAVSTRTVQEGRRTRFGKAVTITGRVANPDSLRSTQIVNDYVAVLRALPELSAEIDRALLQSLQRDEGQGVFNFNILVELKVR